MIEIKKMKSKVLLAFDIETTGLSEQTTILSLAAVRYDTLNHFYAEITHPKGAYCEAKAFEVNRFNILDLQRKSDLKSKSILIGTLEEVDNLFSKWLKKIDNDIILTGLNVLTFDARYAQKYLPKSYALFTKHHGYCVTAELNNFINGISYFEESNFKLIKNKAKEYAENKIIKIRSDLKSHNALYDATKIAFNFSYLITFKDNI